MTFLVSAAVLPLIALAVAACGGSGAATAAPPAAPAKTTTTPTPTPKATIRVANSSFGRILVDSSGNTLYLFKADSGTSSACSDGCAIAWPPLRTGGTPAVAGGANSALVGTISRSDGTRQVTYHGHPLYTFVKDKKPGDVNGQGVTAFGAAWFAVSPAGNEIASQPATHGGGSARPSTPAAPPAAKPHPAPKPAPPVAKPAPPVAKPAPPANGIPQNNGGDGDSDNNGGPSDGDGEI
jgi:predicted lipoprotein with Yx(FWY)xxD motif